MAAGQGSFVKPGVPPWSPIWGTFWGTLYIGLLIRIKLNMAEIYPESSVTGYNLFNIDLMPLT